MNAHPPRWGIFTVAIVLVLVLLGWAWWEHDLLDSQDAGLALAIILIVLGVIGIVATAWRSWPGRTPPPAPPAPRRTDIGTGPAEERPRADVHPDEHEPTRVILTTTEGGPHGQEADPKP